MRFLLTPNYASAYDWRMMNGLARALVAAGHETEVAAHPLSDAEAVARCREYGIDVLFQVNRFRPSNPPLPPATRHITWVQDVFSGTLDGVAERVRTTDLVYTLGDAQALGLNVSLPCPVGCLFTGIDEEILNRPAASRPSGIDFSLCGYVPGPVRKGHRPIRTAILLGNAVLDHLPIDIGRRWPLPTSLYLALCEAVEESYRPLRGELDIHLIAARLREIGEFYVVTGHMEGARYTWPGGGSWGETRRRTVLERVVSYLSRDYPRLLDRQMLVRRILRVSHSLELYGPGWRKHREFRPYSKGILETQEELLSVYRRSRINLANNTHGLGLHSRTLECMAVGGFIFMHASSNDTRSGGMLTEFEPGTHFGQYTPDNLEEEAARWLGDDVGRIETGARAAALVRERHLWKHRAQQILADLRG